MHTEPCEIWIRLKERQQEMTTMRSVVADTLGEPSEVLHLQARPIPEPGPGQVRIRVAAVPVHASDLHTVRGRYGFTPEFPTVPGIESVGVIDELGSGTDGLTSGNASSRSESGARGRSMSLPMPSGSCLFPSA